MDYDLLKKARSKKKAFAGLFSIYVFYHGVFAFVYGGWGLIDVILLPFISLFRKPDFNISAGISAICEIALFVFLIKLTKSNKKDIKFLSELIDTQPAEELAIVVKRSKKEFKYYILLFFLHLVIISLGIEYASIFGLLSLVFYIFCIPCYLSSKKYFSRAIACAQ